MSTHPSRHVTPAHCPNLRHKGMYVAGESDAEPLEAYREPIEATAFWCGRTQKAFGPDGHPVTAELCRAGRGCCD
jgi:hypothetical protein